MSCSDNWLVPAANPCLGVKEVIAGTNVTITGSIYTPTINATGGPGGGVTSLAYTTGINGSAATGAITLSNTGVTSIIAGTGVSISGGTGAVTVTNTGITSLGAGTGISVSVSTITNTGVTSIIAGSGIGISGGTGAVTISNTSVVSSGITSLVAGSNISITNTSTINVSANPVFSNSMGFNGFGTNSVFGNVSYPYGSPTQYYPYVTNAGTDVLNSIGGKQFWATLTPGTTTVPVMRYRYDGIEAQQANTGTTIPFLIYNDTTGLFGLSNTSNVVNSNIAGTGISLSGATGNVTITNSGVTSFALTGGSGLYNLGSSTAPILGALVIDVLSGTGISVASSSGNKTVTNTGVTSIIAGTGITVSGATGAVTIDATGGGGGSLNSRFTPVINGAWTAVDGDVELLDRPLSFSVISNLATAETIVVHFSCGPILGTSTAGPTNASYFSMKALVSPSAGGTPVPTGAYGQYVVDYGATMGGDFVVVLSKARGEFFPDSSLMMLYKMDLPAAPFSSAILPAIAVPNIYVNIYAM